MTCVVIAECGVAIYGMHGDICRCVFCSSYIINSGYMVTGYMHRDFGGYRFLL